MAAITVRACAKINLALRVKEKRDDGFHEVQTILQTIDLCDRLECRPTRGPFRILCDAPGVPADERNLIWQAAERLWRAAGRRGSPRGIVVELEKRIPPQAGLGGGSSDAAAALVGLRRAWNLPIGDEELARIGAALGADVPFFFIGGTAIGLARGDEIYPLLDLPRWWAVVVCPPFGVATADAYRWLDEARGGAGPATVRGGRASASGSTGARLWPGTLVPLGNDFEPVVAARHPEIRTAVTSLERCGARLAAMSGSGSSVFGIFDSRAAAASAARALRAPGTMTLVARLVPRVRRR